jgi:transposase, IS6 family
VTPSNPYKWRHYPGDIILWCVRWYLRFPISFVHMAEMALKRGLFIHPSCIWRWVQIYGPELDKRCRVHLKSTHKSYRVDETYIRIKGHDRFSIPGRGFRGPNGRLSAHGQAGHGSSQTILPENIARSSQSATASDQRRQEPRISGSRRGAQGRRLARGYPSFWTAWRILVGIEVIHMIRKGRVRWVAKGDSLAQMQFINELFGLAI